MSRTLGPLSGVAVALLLIANSACVHRGGPSRGRVIRGTCESTCERYQSCKGVDDPESYQSCFEDCRVIYSEDGEMDRASLRRLEAMECSQLLAFIDGRSD